MSDAEFEALIAEARRRYAEMPRAERIALEREHKINWVWGEMKLSGHNITRERIEEILWEQERAR